MEDGGWSGEPELKSQKENAGEERTGRGEWMAERGLKAQIENAVEQWIGSGKRRRREDSN